MPLSQFHQSTTKDKPESAQSRMNNCSADLFTMPDHEFAELLWENGQIVMQGHSSRPKKSSFTTTFSSHAAGGVHEKDGRDAGNPKASRFDAVEPMVNDFSPSGPSAAIGVHAQDDDIVPWIGYHPIVDEPLAKDALQNDYCSEFLNEFPGANLNSPSAYNKPMATDGIYGLGQDIRNSHDVEHEHASKAFAGSSEPGRDRTSLLYQFSRQHCLSSAPNSESIATDTRIGNSTKTHLQNQDPSSPKPPQLNFSNFSRPAMLAKASLHGVDGKSTDEKASAAPLNSNTVESTLIGSASVFKSAAGVQGQSVSVPPKMELRSSVKPPQEVMIPVERSEAICQQDASWKNNSKILPDINCSKPPDELGSSSTVVASVALIRRRETEKASEAVVASSSACSANSAGAASNDPGKGEKRKSHEGEESGYQSEDFEDMSVGLRKHATGRGTSAKRSRAAEVHNLSERRRRDRINEKMRALQELIPNCNKTDKASMLDEAIEYLKTLQMQVQIMSMNSGLCMPQLLLPPGMQHVHAPAMVRYSPMGVGMGMGIGFGYGMRMYGMNGSPSCSMIPVPPMHGPQFPCSSIPASLGLHGMPRSVNHQMFGVPGQGGPLSIPRPSLFGSLSGLSVRANSVPGIAAPATCPASASDTAPTSISEDRQQQNMEALHGSSVDESRIQTPDQACTFLPWPAFACKVNDLL